VKRDNQKPKWVEEILEEYDDLEPGGKFVFWWLSSLALVIVFAIVFFSIVWTPWVGGTALIIVAVLITAGCFFYIEENS
jgi:hypothetical protein